MVVERDRLRCLRRPTMVSRLEEEVPRPAGGVPEFGLPIWYDIPLDRPLSILVPPQGSVVFTRGKLGRKLRKCKSAQERQFVLTDPLLRNSPSLQYEPLHDKDLRGYFSRSRVREHLKKAGFITAEGDVLCSFQQFAQYRRYLGALHRLAVAAELRRREETNKAARLLTAARTKWVKTKNDMFPACIDGLNKIPDEECCIGNCRNCQCPCLQKTEPVAKVTPRPWRTPPWKKLKSGRRQHKVTRRWLEKSHLQLQTKYWNEELLRKHKEATRERVSALRMAYKKHWDMMDDKLRNAKRTREYLRSQQFTDRLRMMSVAFMKTWQERAETETQKKIPPVALLLSTTRPERDSFYGLMQARQRLESYKKQPEAVTCVVDELLGNAVNAYTTAEVIKMVKEVLERLIKRVSKAMESTDRSRRLSSVFAEVLRRSSSVTVSPTSVARRSYNPSIEEKGFSDLETLPPTPFIDEEQERRRKSVRFQMPSESEVRWPTTQHPTKITHTPMPSVTQLVEAVFEDGMLELSRKVSFHEQAKLRSTLRSVASFLRDSVLHAPDHKLKAMKRRFIHQDYSSYAIQDECIEKVIIQLATVITTRDLQQVLESKEIKDVSDCLLYKIINVVLRDKK